MKPRILHILFFFFISIVVFAQEMRVVSGIISDDSGEPLIGVSVLEKGTTNGIVTNFDGYYEIIVPLGSTLQFSYIGMKTSEMKVNESNSKPAVGYKTPAASKIIPAVEITESISTKKKESNKKTEQAIIISREDQSLSPYFLVKSNSYNDASMPLKNTDVTVSIAGVIADVNVKQVYINEGENTLEAIYVFPGSTRAAVYGMAMTIGDRRIEAKIKRKEQARQEYEQAKQEGKSTTLLEQHRPNVFQMNVANILPGDTIIVEMQYTELLENEKGLYEFVYPTVVGPRYSEGGEEWVDRSTAQFESGRTPQFSIKTTVQAGMPIQKISSVSHSLTIESPSPDQAIITLSNPKDYEGDRDYILQYELQGGKVQSGLLRYEHGDENFFLLMMQPPKKPTLAQIPPREYVFIIDVSGSMYGFPLELSKDLIRNLISGLRPVDRFNVMLFESSSAMLYEKSVAATQENIQKAMEVIDRQRGGGGTRLYPAIQKAMDFKETKGFSRTFLILTDGYVSIEKEAFNYVRNHLNEANLFSFGIGTSVNRYLIEGLAHAGMGTPYIVTNHTQAEAVGQKAIKEISEPVLTNISIDWDDFDVYDVEPVAIPDVFSERPILIYGKYKGTAEGTITISGTAGDTNYEQKFDIAEAKQEYNQALRYLWARNQIRYYDDFAQFYEGDINHWGSNNKSRQSPKQIEYITNLGLKYNLLTQYTSFLAVDQEVRAQKTAPVSQNNNSTYSPVQQAKPSTPQSVSAPNFTLSEDQQQLEDVVVVGYGIQRKESVTGSAHTTSDIKSSSITQAFQGRLAGVIVSQTAGEPDAAARIRIRGASSIMGNSEPLVVLDGKPIEYSDFSQMNTSDIETITVLKDASATAIYGARAANGVLVVNSKKQGYERLSGSFTSTFSVEAPNKLPEMQNKYTQGRQENGSPVWNTENEPFSWGPHAKDVSAPTYDTYDIFETGYSFKNHLTLSGRQRNHYYGLKLGNNTQHGFIPESKYSGTSAGLNFGRKEYRKLKYDIDFSFRNTKGNRLQRGYNMSGIMQGILLTPPTFDNRESTLGNGEQRSAGNAADNPYWRINNNPFNDETNRFTGKFSIGYNPLNKLSLDYHLSGDYMDSESKTALNTGSVYFPTGHVMNRNEKFKSLLSRFSAEYNYQWRYFRLGSTIGHEYTISERNIDRQDGYHLSQAGDYNVQHTDSIVSYKRNYDRHSNSIFGRISLSYDNMATVEAAMRGEWSSVNNRALVSPYAGVSINLDEIFDCEPFSRIRLYGNISRTDKETPLYIDPMYFNSAIYNLNDASQHFESREVILNNLKPETITHYSAGTDISLWNNRINLSASLYRKNGKNQLLPVQVSTSSVQLENAGTFRTNGQEIELGAFPFRSRRFTWDTRLIFTRERNTVTNLGGRKLMLAGIEGEVGSYAIEGQPLGVLYGTAYERDEQGRMLIGDDGFPIKNNELKVLGNPNPDWQMSWSNSFTYKDFTLSFLFDFKKGGDMWNGTQSTMNYYGTSQYSADHRNTTGHVFPGVLSDGSINNIPVSFYGNNLEENRWVRYGQYGVGEDAIEDASYLKLREIALSYRLPVRISGRNTLMNFSIFATNILLFSKYSGVDPETNLTGASNGYGLDYFNIPGVHSIGISFKWDF